MPFGNAWNDKLFKDCNFLIVLISSLRLCRSFCFFWHFRRCVMLLHGYKHWLRPQSPVAFLLQNKLWLGLHEMHSPSCWLQIIVGLLRIHLFLLDISLNTSSECRCAFEHDMFIKRFWNVFHPFHQWGKILYLIGPYRSSPLLIGGCLLPLWPRKSSFFFYWPNLCIFWSDFTNCSYFSLGHFMSGALIIFLDTTMCSDTEGAQTMLG